MTAKGKHRDFPDKETLNKYLKGELSPEEAHQFEKAILHDPFYQDALDGIDMQNANDVKEDIMDLSHRIKRRAAIQKRKINNYYRIAAVIILFAVLSYTLILTSNRLDRISKKETVTQKLEGAEDSLPTRVQSKEPVIEDAEESEAELAEIIAEEDIDQDGIPPVIKELDTEPAPDRDIETIPQEPITEIIEEQDEVDPDLEFMEEETETAPQFAIIEDKAEKDMVALQYDTEEDAAISEELLTPEEEVLVKSVEEATPKRLEDSESTKAMRRKAQEPVAKNAGYTPSISDLDAEEYLQSEPVIGFEAYKHYIADNLQYPTDALENGIEGFVELEFIIDKDSIPAKIKITKSLSGSCDKEAIRLLENGPKWKPIILDDQLYDQKIHYTIAFELKD